MSDTLGEAGADGNETAQQLHRVKRMRSGPNQDTVLIRIGDIAPFFKALKHRSPEIKELDPCRDCTKDSLVQSNSQR
ncbi:unnamed protein product [Pocillopora meandrina]|uniref:Uncharacterized protein n=1 Tax=Pocillopora meandrina TaxID=46732 RepID=A0AAU9XC35_9CNID|nr:unnamed protein product [Pocillopora meandrina]